ncbi:cell envelope integrity protein TolA [Massilibacteroides sp.]|uniref:type IX secretion system periplasmic lipoprotein PorW/SprE n=1 Tax=Massilibacteroides sp. TaxID=2034766 RepID=UPI002613EE72|nr:cell envelope integrity protein TolA [Massilibacteroides sp.]MDD4515744.1 cell envelope integrity protein TolA [Massilibacteroides sp.]
MKNGFYYITSLVLIGLLVSCSTKKNTKASRFYHAVNSRYNIYYNGKTSFDEALEAMQTGYKENYSERIYMFPISAQPKEKQTTGGAFDRAIEKSNKAIKLHSIKTKPPKKPGWRNNPKQVAIQEQEEYNPFLKHCWLLMGQAQFYNADFLEASATFSYIARHYATDEEVVSEAKLWQARSYSEMNWLYESENILNKLNTNGIHPKKLKLYATVYADYLIKNNQTEEAIPYLQTAIKAEKNGKQRARMKYLLGQIYTELELNSLAYKAFGDVIKSNPPYELEFAARIRQTEVFAGNNYMSMVKKLEGMARSDKNKDYLDQVYYAIGNIYITQEDTTNAIVNYQSGIEKSTKKGIEKALCEIRLGDIYFKQGEYVKAQPCFSGALASLQKEYKDYKRIAKLSEVLDELVIHVEAVHLQDSLQTLAKMPESERLAVIDAIIAQVEKEEKEAKEQADKEAYLSEQEAKGTGIDRPGTEINVPLIPTGSDGSSFYFYNAQAVAQGKTKFQRQWGRRTLEDDWRRRKKEMATFMEQSDQVADTNLSTTNDSIIVGDSIVEGLPEELTDDPKTREFYLQQIPFTPEDIEASNLIIMDGLYHMAMIYKDKLEDFRLSIDAFETLERRFPDHEFRLESYYQIYLMALRLKDVDLANRYKTKLINAFPESNYAIAIADPNYEYNIRMMDTMQDSIYRETYQHYLSEDIATVRRNFKTVSEKYPLAGLMPKFMFLDALTYVQEGDPEGFKEALKALVEKYPDADVTELAGEMLKGVLRGRAMVQGGVRGMTWNLRFGVGEDGALSAADSARVFKVDPNSPYKMLLIYPTDRVNKNQLLYAVAAYNFANFLVKQLDISVEQNGPMSIMTLSEFVNLDEATQYYKMIYGKEGYANTLNKEIAILPISGENQETLLRGKTLDEYVTFFADSLGQKIPELKQRWEIRLNDNEEAEKEEATETVLPEETITEVPEQVEKTEEPEISVGQDSIPIVSDTITLIPEVPVVTEAPDSTEVTIPVAPVNEGLTLKQIEEIRKREAEEEEARKEAARIAFEEEQRAEQELREQKTREREELLKKQKEEEAALLKAKAEQEKQLEKDRKAKLKQREAERKAKLKAQQQLRKEKERAYKERQKLKEKERKEKERAYKQKLKEKEKARKKALKEKEAAAKKRR